MLFVSATPVKQDDKQHSLQGSHSSQHMSQQLSIKKSLKTVEGDCEIVLMERRGQSHIPVQRLHHPNSGNVRACAVPRQVRGALRTVLPQLHCPCGFCRGAKLQRHTSAPTMPSPCPNMSLPLAHPCLSGTEGL